MNHTAGSAASHLDTIRCGLYFTGQNLFYLLVYMYMNAYFTDIGIPVLAVAGIALLVKLVDAFMTPLLCGWLHRLQQRTGRWLRLTVLAVPLTAVALFSIPYELSVGGKILWATMAFLIWDITYTVCNAPLFGMEGAVTEIRQGHTVLSAVGRICAMGAAVVLMVVIPSFRAKLGGWSATVAVLSLAGLLTMVPACVGSRPRTDYPEARRFVTLGQIRSYLRGNRYLSVFYLAFVLTGVMNVTSCWGLYMARCCLHNEALLSVSGLLTMIPGILVGAVLPTITRRMDKFKLYYHAVFASLVMQLARYFIGYNSVPAYLLAATLAAVPTGITTSILFQFTNDCAEYGRYLGQDPDPALPFATQMFFVKLQSAGVMAFGSLMLAAIGFVEGEGAVQSAEFADRLWNAGLLIPAAGMLAGLLVLRQYGLRDHDVALMQMCNDGLISREEASRQLGGKIPFPHSF